jgi:hypothetical protein
VVGAACMFCRWLSNPTEEQKSLFSYHPQFWYLCKYPFYLLFLLFFWKLWYLALGPTNPRGPIPSPTCRGPI